MRRTAPRHVTGRREADVRKNLSGEQLEWIGSVAIAWNELEILIDFAMANGLGVRAPLWDELTTRINGIEGKLQLVRKSLALLPEIEEQTVSLITNTLDAATECKKYRDGVIHARVFDAPTGIGVLMQRRAKSEHVLLTVEALRGLYDRLVLLRHEMGAIVLMLHGLTIYRSRSARTDASKKRAEEAALGYASQLREHQMNRRSLPPLPQFPELPPEPQETEGIPSE
jgi:hypothetical protein